MNPALPSLGKDKSRWKRPIGARSSSASDRFWKALKAGCETSRTETLRQCRRAGAVAMLLVVSATSGCRPDMFEQPSSKPLERSSFFADRMAARLAPAHTVAQGQLRENTVLYSGKIGTNLATGYPFPITRAALERGRERYEIYCAVCHGRTGDGQGMIVLRGYPAPPSYHIERLREAPIGHFYDVITQGYGIMYSYASRVAPADRWRIAAYIRVLQLSQNARESDLSDADRVALKALTP